MHSQIRRVKKKLPLARTTDNNLKIFGAESHKYQLNKSLTDLEIGQFEQANRITLPKDFRLFLTELGNGGTGPYYGIHKLDPKETQTHLSKPCKLHPDLTDEDWNRLIGDEDDDDDDLYETIYQGMLYIGTQGCTYNMMLIVSGESRGKVVYTDDDLSKPFFTYEDNFLDWYERWLDEIIKGYKIFWFGMNMDGDEEKLIHNFQTSCEEESKKLAISSMHKFPQLSTKTIHFLEGQCDNNSRELKNISLQILIKHSYLKAKPFLQQLMASEDENDKLISLKYIYWYAKEHAQDWIEEIKTMLATNHNPDIERFANYILERAK